MVTTSSWWFQTRDSLMIDRRNTCTVFFSFFVKLGHFKLMFIEKRPSVGRTPTSNASYLKHIKIQFSHYYVGVSGYPLLLWNSIVKLIQEESHRKQTSSL